MRDCVLHFTLLIVYRAYCILIFLLQVLNTLMRKEEETERKEHRARVKLPFDPVSTGD